MEEVINENDQQSIIECILYLIDDYLEKNLKMYKEDKFIDEIYNAIFTIVKDIYDINIISTRLLHYLVNYSIEYYFNTINLPRSLITSPVFNINTEDRDKIKAHINSLKGMTQYVQLSDKWFKERHTKITASSAWKAIDTQCNQNSLILQKCEPFNPNKYNRVNVKSTFHHGHKYEPLSTQFYESLYNTKIEDLGCIPHSQYNFLGASPDGINIKYENNRYGRLLEIKNIYNRKITGIPKKAYWIQMQLQMEVCKSQYCDFLETRFKEFETEEEFEKGNSFHLTENGKMKGIFICFHSTDGPVYKYPPFQCERVTFNAWYDTCMDKYAHLTWVRNIYWRLDEYSCVLVPRNKKWFNEVLPDFKTIWNTIQTEKISGYEHRKPKKREKKPKAENVIILKVRTESFNESQLKEALES